MTNRRQFLQSAAALSAAPLVSHRAFAGATSYRDQASPDVLILDSRHPAAQDFGLSAARSIRALREIQGDITSLWQNELREAWSRHQLPVAGLTERPALFLLERLAWDHGMRVVFEAEHSPDDQGRFSHRVIRSADHRLEDDLVAATEHWPAVLAEALVSGRRTAMTDFHPTGAAMAEHLQDAHTVKLHSWIIAPRNAV